MVTALVIASIGFGLAVVPAKVRGVSCGSVFAPGGEAAAAAEFRKDLKASSYVTECRSAVARRRFLAGAFAVLAAGYAVFAVGAPRRPTVTRGPG